MMPPLFSEANAYEAGLFATDDGNELYYERHGNPAAKQKVIYLHGGPGAGCSYQEYRWFHPDHFDVLLFDQRWAPRSRPAPGIGVNSIDLCIVDIEALRRHFGFGVISLAGGSWGAALATFYAGRHATQVRRLLLRGFFFADAAGADYIVEAHGAAAKNPNRWFEAFRDFIPEAERQDGLMRPYYERLMRDDATAVEAARLFTLWDTSICTYEPRQDLLDEVEADPLGNLALSRAYFQFSIHEFAAARRREIVEGIARTAMPIDLIHGRQDHICPIADAEELVRLRSGIRLTALDRCGHSMAEPALQAAFISVTEKWRASDGG